MIFFDYLSVLVHATNFRSKETVNDVTKQNIYHTFTHGSDAYVFLFVASTLVQMAVGWLGCLRFRITEHQIKQVHLHKDLGGEESLPS